MKYRPIVIIGAPRSGTNMLRDVLCSLPDMATWPCDEINYIWRHGNVAHRSDELVLEMARPAVMSYIRRQFDWVAYKYNAGYVIEKTCANSLRVPFVDAVIQDAKYIFVTRDGLDVVGSAVMRWKAKLDLLYLMRKVRFVPLNDLPFYGGRYLWNRVYRMFSRDERLAFWGPRLEGMNELLEHHPLDEVCALQWQACIDKAATAFAGMDDNRWIKVSYEDFVLDTESQLSRILEFVGLHVPDEILRAAVKNVRPDSIGKGRSVLDEDAYQRVQALVYDTLECFGYVS